ncbi:MAG: DUF1127 domain-containing protein [Pseudomonadota bacterium]
MAVIDTLRTPRANRAPLRYSLQSIVAAFAAWNDARITRNALSKLSDRELDDIGLSRSDIDRVTR